MELIGTAGSAVAAVCHCGVAFMPRLRQKEKQFHLQSAEPGQMISILCPSAAEQLLCRVPAPVSLLTGRVLLLCPPGAGGWEKDILFHQALISSNLLGMKRDPSFLGVLLSR